MSGGRRTDTIMVCEGSGRLSDGIIGEGAEGFTLSDFDKTEQKQEFERSGHSAFIETRAPFRSHPRVVLVFIYERFRTDRT